MRRPHGFFLLYFAFALLFAQQGAIWHALSHWNEGAATHHEEALPHSAACDECVVYAGIGGAVATTSFFFAPQQGIVVLAVVLFALRVARSFHFFHPRAPPFRT